MESTSKVLVVGIGGPSGCGKTQLAKSLEKYFREQRFTQQCEAIYIRGKKQKPKIPNDPVIHGDTYFKRKNCPMTEFGIINMEIPEAINYEKLIASVTTTKSKLQQTPNTPPVLIVEGFLLYCNPTLVQLLDKKILLMASKDTCYVRRRDRRPHKNGEHFTEYYDKYVWPCFEENKKKYDDLDVVEINTDNLTQKEVFEKVLKLIEVWIPNLDI